MKTFEEGEWLAYQYEMWIVKEIRKEGKKIRYTISNGGVETSVYATDTNDTFKLTLPIKNLIDDFQYTKKEFGRIATHGVNRGLNWPHLHGLFSHHFSTLAELLERNEGNFEDAKFKKSYELKWEQYQEFCRHWMDSIKAANRMAVDGVSLFGT